LPRANVDTPAAPVHVTAMTSMARTIVAARRRRRSSTGVRSPRVR